MDYMYRSVLYINCLNDGMNSVFAFITTSDKQIGDVCCQLFPLLVDHPKEAIFSGDCFLMIPFFVVTDHLVGVVKFECQK